MLSDNIRNLRKTKGWSQEELAIKLNVVRQTISKWEKGLSVPDSEMLIRIAEELDTTVGVLLGEPELTDKKSAENLELKEIAAKLEFLNEQFAKRSERQRKIWRIIFIALGVFVIFTLFYETAGFLYFRAVMENMDADTSIIGGYDGPTSIYVSNMSFGTGKLILTLLVAVLSIVGIYKTRRK